MPSPSDAAATGMVAIALQQLGEKNSHVQVVEWDHIENRILAKLGGDHFIITAERVVPKGGV